MKEKDTSSQTTQLQMMLDDLSKTRKEETPRQKRFKGNADAEEICVVQALKDIEDILPTEEQSGFENSVILNGEEQKQLKVMRKRFNREEDTVESPMKIVPDENSLFDMPLEEQMPAPHTAFSMEGFDEEETPFSHESEYSAVTADDAVEEPKEELFTAEAKPVKKQESTVVEKEMKRSLFAKKNQDDNAEKKKPKQKKPTSIWIEVLDILRTVIICFLIAWLFSTYIVKPIRVQGVSMYPTLQNGDIGLSNVLQAKDIKRFDVVVVFEPWLDDYVIKRIIGLPGETIEYKENTLYINGAAIPETFLDETYTTTMSMQRNDYFTADFGPVSIEPDEYFIMGDNRPISSDSREHGAIKKDKIASKDAFILFPFGRVGGH